MYEIETERSLLSRTTIIRKPFTSAFFRFLEHHVPPLIWDLEVHRCAHDQMGEGNPYPMRPPKSRGSSGRRGLLTGLCIMSAV